MPLMVTKQNGIPFRAPALEAPQPFRFIKRNTAPPPVPPFSRAPFTDPDLLFPFINPIVNGTNNPMDSWGIQSGLPGSGNLNSAGTARPATFVDNTAFFDGAAMYQAMSVPGQIALFDDMTFLIALQRNGIGSTQYIFRAEDGAGGIFIRFGAGNDLQVEDNRPTLCVNVSVFTCPAGSMYLLSIRLRRGLPAILGKGGTYETGISPADNAPLGTMSSAYLSWLAFFLNAQVAFVLAYKRSLSDAEIDTYRADLSNTSDFGTLGVTL